MMLPPGAEDFLWMFKNGVWGVGTASWMFGISDRTLAAFMDGYLSAIDITQLLTALFFFSSWLILKPSREQPAQTQLVTIAPVTTSATVNSSQNAERTAQL